ncbi:MAG: hypothetical protein ACLQNE_00940 [Thermoguttaceae bacterium]
MNHAERILVILLRAVAVAASMAIVPVFMPHAWMDTCHGWLGLGTLAARATEVTGLRTPKEIEL